MSHPNKDNMNLIQCGDHKWAPWSILCTHLIEGTSRDWVGVESNNPEVDFDYLCPECDEQMQAASENEEDIKDTPLFKNLRCICMHCVKIVREKFDPVYEESEK